MNRADFTAWLNTQDRLDAGRCPLAHYLGLGSIVGRTLYTPRGQRTLDMPFWAVRFTFAIDNSHEMSWNDPRGWYSARAVEDVLATIPDDPVEIIELKQAA